MSAVADVLPFPALLIGYLMWLPVLLTALLSTPYAALGRNRVQHLFLASVVGLMATWHFRAGVIPGLEFHFMTMTAVTLVLGWALAVIAGSIAALGMCCAGVWAGQILALEVLLSVMVPVLMTSLLLEVTLRHWPTNPFAYIFGGGFFGGALGAAVSVLIRVVILGLYGVYPVPVMVTEYLPFLPLYMFPEAVLNGMLVTVLVVYRPGWLRTYRRVSEH